LQINCINEFYLNEKTFHFFLFFLKFVEKVVQTNQNNRSCTIYHRKLWRRRKKQRNVLHPLLSSLSFMRGSLGKQLSHLQVCVYCM